MHLAHRRDAFELVACINLREREDRHARMRSVFASLSQTTFPELLNSGGGGGVWFFRPERDPRGGTAGCFASHVAVVRAARERGCSTVLVFEDDVIPTIAAYDRRTVKTILDAFFSPSSTFEYMQLGHSILPHEMSSYILGERSGSLVRFTGNLAHAYALTRGGMDAVLDAARSVPIGSIDYDVFLRKLFGAEGRATGCVCIPQLFAQDFCDANDNAPATSAYYAAMRAASCMSTRIDLFFRASVVKSRGYAFVLCIFIAFLLIAIARRNQGFFRAAS